MTERFPYATRAAQHHDRDYFATLSLAFRKASPEMIRGAASRRRGAGQRARSRVVV